MQLYRRVSYAERCQINALLETKISVLKISQRLGVHRSTIYREIKRNSFHNGYYEPKLAEKLSQKRFESCRRTRIFNHRENLEQLKTHLQKDLSPEQISGRIGLASHQTIYNEIQKYRRELAVHLRRFGKRRSGGRHYRREKPPNPEWYVPLSKRPKHVEKREEFGHWERDTMYVKNRKMLLVCVERKSRYVRIAKLPGIPFRDIAKKTPELIKIGNVKPLTITNDRGGEFRGKTNIRTPIYFCDPNAPQQRGTIENTIGLIRQYLPRTRNFKGITQKEIKWIEARLNRRPRKCLDYRTPREVLLHKTVALAV